MNRFLVSQESKAPRALDRDGVGNCRQHELGPKVWLMGGKAEARGRINNVERRLLWEVGIVCFVCLV